MQPDAAERDERRRRGSVDVERPARADAAGDREILDVHVVGRVVVHVEDPVDSGGIDDRARRAGGGADRVEIEARL